MKLGRDVLIHESVNAYGCEIGDYTRVGAFVEIQAGAVIGSRCKISSHTFVCTGVTIEDECFVGHHVVFVNDRYPAAVGPDGELQISEEWELVKTRVCKGASIGSGAVIMCGITIGEDALVGAGSVVVRDVEPNQIVVGNPARPTGKSRW